MSEEAKPAEEKPKEEQPKPEEGEEIELDLESEEFKKKIEGKELWLVTVEGCGGCEEIKNILNEAKLQYKEIKAEEVPEILDLFDSLGEKYFPSILAAKPMEEGKYLVCNVTKKEANVCALFSPKEKKI
jgi:glutaredoxin